MDHLKNLHDSYVITPIDKVTGNVTFICQRFYALVLVKIAENSKQQQKTAAIKTLMFQSLSLKLTSLSIMKPF